MIKEFSCPRCGNRMVTRRRYRIICKKCNSVYERNPQLDNYWRLYSVPTKKAQS